MKILFVAEVFYPENFLINDLAPELVKRGYEVEVLTRQPSYPDGIVYPGYSNEPYSKEVWKGGRCIASRPSRGIKRVR